MSYLPTDYIVCTSLQWNDIQRLGDFGDPRRSFLRDLLLVNLNGNLPLSEYQKITALQLGAEVMPQDQVTSGWLVQMGFDTDSIQGE